MGGEIYDFSWTCVASYAAPHDTFVYFELKKGDSNLLAAVILAFNKILFGRVCKDDATALKKGKNPCFIQVGNTLKSGKGRSIREQNN